MTKTHYALCSSLLFTASALISMEEKNQPTRLELFESLKNKMSSYLSTNQIQSLECFKAATQESSVKLDLECNPTTEWTLELQGAKKSFFEGIFFYEKLKDLHIKQSSVFKVSFEENNLDLATRIREDEKTIVISMYLRKAGEQKKEDKKEQKRTQPTLSKENKNLQDEVNIYADYVERIANSVFNAEDNGTIQNLEKLKRLYNQK